MGPLDCRIAGLVLLLLLEATGHVSMAVAQPLGTFTAAGNMTTPRAGHTATLLLDGRVLVVGGDQTGTAELFDPVTGTFRPTGNVATGHGGTTALFGAQATATLLPDGRVLIVGVTKSELYDPANESFSVTGNLIVPQTGFTATLLNNGKVLISGGSAGDSDCCAIAANPELYDPATGTFGLTGAYADAGSITRPGAGTSGLAYTTATLMSDGTLLISSEPTAEVYDPVSNTFSLTGSMVTVDEMWGNPTQISGRASALLNTGHVLLAGGDLVYFDTGDGPMANAEEYDPTAGSFSATGFMHWPRQGGIATTLSDGTPLITGGVIDGFYNATKIAELYSSTTGSFSVAADMQTGRAFHQATLLGDGRVLITGGTISNSPPPDYSYQVLASAEIYNPLASALLPPVALLSLSDGQAAIQHASTYQLVSSDNPAAAGEVLVIYCTGLIDGSAIPPQVAIGGRLAEVLWFGGVPGYPGLNQINARVPAGLAGAGAVPVRVSYVGRPSNQVTIEVGHEPGR